MLKLLSKLLPDYFFEGLAFLPLILLEEILDVYVSTISRDIKVLKEFRKDSV